MKRCPIDQLTETDWQAWLADEMVTVLPPQEQPKRLVQSPDLSFRWRRHLPDDPNMIGPMLDLAAGETPEPVEGIFMSAWTEHNFSWINRQLNWNGYRGRWSWRLSMTGPRWQRPNPAEALAASLDARFAAAAQAGQHDEVFTGEGDLFGVAVYRFGRIIVQWSYSYDQAQLIMKATPAAAERIFRVLREQDRMSAALSEAGPLPGTALEARDRVQMLREGSVFLDALDHDEINPEHFKD